MDFFSLSFIFHLWLVGVGGWSILELTHLAAHPPIHPTLWDIFSGLFFMFRFFFVLFLKLYFCLHCLIWDCGDFSPCFWGLEMGNMGIRKGVRGNI
jgi:hypothetical protein